MTDNSDRERAYVPLRTPGFLPRLAADVDDVASDEEVGLIEGDYGPPFADWRQTGRDQRGGQDVDFDLEMDDAGCEARSREGEWRREEGWVWEE